METVIAHEASSAARSERPSNPLRTAAMWVAREPLLAAACTVGAALRIAGDTRFGLWTDELYAVWEARQPLRVMFDPKLHLQHPPGYRLALHFWMAINQSEMFIRLFAVVSGVLLIPAMWAAARALWPRYRSAAGTAALLAATSPYLLHYSQDVTSYGWTALWITVSVWTLARAWATDRSSWWAAWTCSVTVALYSHYLSVFPAATEALAVAIAGLAAGAAGRKRLAHAAASLACVVCLGAPWIAVLLARAGAVVHPVLFPLTVDRQIIGWLPRLLAGYAHPGFWLQRVGVRCAWGVFVFTVMAGAWRMWRRRATNDFVALGAVLAWSVTAYLGSYLFTRLTTPPTAVDPARFAAFAVPALLLALAASVAALPTRIRTAALAVWIAVAAVQWSAEMRAAPQEDWRGTLGVIAARAQPDDVLLAFPAFHAGAAAAYYRVPLDVQGGWFVAGDTPEAVYWFSPGWHWRGFLDPAAYRTADFAAEVRRRTSHAGRIWYLAGDGVDGTYPRSVAAERSLESAGWQPTEEWHTSWLVLRLYERSAH